MNSHASSTSPIPSANPGAAEQTLFGHPLGLYVLFLTELWERFTYYGMRAILILYMTNQFLWTQQEASRIFKWYTALVYFTPMIGGFLADRYLGNKRAVIIGSILMAIGQFMMAVDNYTIFYSALTFLIIGNGFFKPNMSIQVGRLYMPGDPRRDGAYTIFYMGINLGAFASPLICGWLGERIGYKWGFIAAGVGMVLGLIIYLGGYRWVVEVSSGSEPAKKPKNAPGTDVEDPTGDRPAIAWLSAFVPVAFLLIAAAALGYGAYILLTARGAARDTGIFCVLIFASLAIFSMVMFRNKGRARDRTIAISSVMIFIVAFWFAFEQAGNTLTVWADKHTDRYIFNFSERPDPIVTLPKAIEPPPAPEGTIASWQLPASWFQSVNPLIIVVLAPAFAWFWVWLSRKQREPSTPMKMAIGVFLVGISFLVMVFGAMLENRPSETKLARMPATVLLKDGALSYEENGETHHHVGGRLRFDAASQKLMMNGVLPDLDRDRILGQSAPETYRNAVIELVAKSQTAAKAGATIDVSITLESTPDGFDLGWSGVKDGVAFDANTKALSATRELTDRDEKLLLLAGADADLRVALFDIYRQTDKFQVSTFWLLLSYLLATMGELCLSPVGLSMVSKLAPVGYATLLMGLWNCNNFFANFLAGFMGELWGLIPPIQFFAIFVGVTVGLALVLFLFVGVIRRLMHGVH